MKLSNQPIPIELVERHPSADNLDICRIHSNQFITPAGKFHTGDIVIPILNLAISIAAFDLLFELYGTSREDYPKFIYQDKSYIKIKPRHFRSVQSDGILWPVEITYTRRNTMAIVVRLPKQPSIDFFLNILDDSAAGDSVDLVYVHIPRNQSRKVDIINSLHDRSKFKFFLDFMNIDIRNKEQMIYIAEFSYPEMIFDPACQLDIYGMMA